MALTKLEFTIDGFADNNGLNAMCNNFYCPDNSFFKQSLSNSHIWINPPFHLLEQTLSHYISEKGKSPDTISACILVPHWPGSSWHHLLQGMHKLHTYPQGYPLFELLSDKGTTAMKGIPWPVSVYYDAPYSPRVIKAISTEGSLTMQFNCTLNGAVAVATADSAASHSFINKRFVKKAGLVCMPDHRVVELADGTHTLTHNKCKVHIRMRSTLKGISYSQIIETHVVELGDDHDILLGEDWLLLEKADLSYRNQECILHPSGGEPIPIPIRKPIIKLSPDTSPISLLKAQRLQRKGAKLFMVNVIDTGVTPMASTDLVEMDDLEAIPPGNLPESVTFPDDISHRVKAVLHKYKRLFIKRKTFPKDQGIEHVINLEPGSKPTFRAGYRLSPAELVEVERHIKEMLLQGLIQPSSSAFGAPLMFVSKPDGSLRPVIDYRKLNTKTEKQRVHMPLIGQLLDQLQGATVFTGLDLASGYHQIPIRAEDIPKTQFVTPFGSYSYKVLPMGLCNAPSTFQALMNKLFREHLGFPCTSTNPSGTGASERFVLIYLDDIIVFSKSKEEHAIHMEKVLKILDDADLYISLKKCDFEKSELKFLGHLVGKDGIKVDPAKTEVIKHWPVPTSISAVRSFCGLANYFRKFLQGYSSMVAPLTNLTRTDVKFDWTAECQEAFEMVKHSLTNAPVLAMPDYTEPFELEVICDASIKGIGAVLLQHGKPIAFESKKLTQTETNWMTGDQELWAVVHALKTWRCYLEGIPFKVITDHNPNTHLQTVSSLSRRQARWAEYLQRFQFTWEYRPGRTNVADPLSRHPDFMLNLIKLASAKTRSGNTPHSPHTSIRKRKLKQPIDKSPIMETASLESPTDFTPTVGSKTVIDDSDIVHLIQTGYEIDKWFADKANTNNLRHMNGLWYHGQGLVVPDAYNLRQKILYELHDAAYSGHGGITKTYRAVLRVFWWPHLKDHVTEYVRTCTSCQRNKSSNLKPGGLLQSLPIPTYPWESISMDYITELPKTKDGYNAILVFVDRLTKMTHLCKCTTNVDSLGTAQLFVEHVWKYHGTPEHIVSDRGSTFVGKFMTEVIRLIGAKHNRSTAFHPQTDGQTERVNRVLEDMLRHYVGETDHTEWDICLPTAEFAINNAFHESIGTTPFRLNYGRDPRLPISLPPTDASSVPSAAQFADRMQEGLESAKQCLAAAQARQKRYYDKGHREASFIPGVQVLLSSKHIHMRTPQGRKSTPKLLPKWLGPFTVEKTVGAVSYKLNLPTTMKIHPVFHVSLLKPYLSDGRVQPPGPVLIDGEAYFTIERILDHRIHKRRRHATQLEYLVKWLDYGAEHNSWEPESSLNDIESGDTLLKYWDYIGLEPPASVTRQLAS